MVPLTRRAMLGASSSALLLRCAPPPPTATTVDGWTVPPTTVLDGPRYARVAAAMDAIVPLATKAQAAWYLDQLLGAFTVDPPRIFAGGPYSGRHGGTNDFAHFLPLTRVEALRWRTYLEGSQGLPEREWNGPVVGLKDRYVAGLDALEAAAQDKHQRAFTALNREQRRGLLSSAEDAFVQTLYEHAVEGTYGDPVYGGNVDRVTWQTLGYEGDRHPLGYSPEQMLHPDQVPEL